MADPDYRRVRAFAETDTRTSPSYSRSGGLYRVEWSGYQQVNGSNFSFQRVDAEAQQLIPIARENWVIALRALASTTDAATGQSVPYFLTPELGGHHTLRGYPSWRFRDRNRMLFTGEYRWTAGSFVDMAIFADTGQVAARLEDFQVRSFKTSYGIGASFHTLTSTVMRVELARSREGNSILFSFGPSF
jgi:outer membrane protein assembly factor BamA